ncbi:hypothetical protein FYL03_07080 [Lactobacillus salivarius]|uniref:hypothetical protein n=1 Tax=Ligilactobacillus salivarius TaxID=1624 RepID=UPI00136EBE4A|nr:hypothetical protein [Ligilactobacillus salivarius]MYZ05291.1 hypothetical protein [Ligilactobacillus salivarius]
MSYRIYNGTQLLGDVNNKSTGINGLLPATSYQLGVTNYNGNRESSKATINVKTRGIRLIIPTSLTVNSTITLNYQEYSLGLVPIGTEPAGMFGGGNKRNIQAKVISVDNGKSTVELLEPLESSSTVSIGGTNLLKKTSNDWKTWTGTGWANQTLDAGSIDLEPGTYTFRAEIDNTGNTQRGVHSELYVDSEKTFLDQIAKSYTQTFVNAGSKGYVTTIFTIDRALTDVRIRPHTAVNSAIPSTVTIKWRREKLEKGTIATDWSPAPEDTQYIVDNTQMNRLQDGSFAAFNGYRAIYFRQ